MYLAPELDYTDFLSFIRLIYHDVINLLFLSEKNNTIDDESIGDIDNDVFKSLIAINKAICAEKEGDYLTALKIHNRLLSNENKINIKVWNERSINSQEELCRWPDYDDDNKFLIKDSNYDLNPNQLLIKHLNNFEKKIQFNLISSYESSSLINIKESDNIKEVMEGNNAITSKVELIKISSFIKSNLHFRQQYRINTCPSSIHVMKELLPNCKANCFLCFETKFDTQIFHVQNIIQFKDSFYKNCQVAQRNESRFSLNNTFALHLNNNECECVLDSNFISLLFVLYAKASKTSTIQTNIPNLFQQNTDMCICSTKRFIEFSVPSFVSFVELGMMSDQRLTEWYNIVYNRSQYAIALSVKRLSNDSHNIFYSTTKESVFNNSLLVDSGTNQLKENYGKIVRLYNYSFLKSTDAMDLVYTYVNGLKLCDQYCRDHILDVVKIIHENPETLSILSSNIPFVPAWIFVRYGAQLMSRLDEPEGEIVVIILEHIAKYYPKALYYRFKVSSENFRQQAKQNTRNLERLLTDHVMDCFVEAIEGLNHPYFRWLDGIKLIKHQRTTEAFNSYLSLCNKTSEFKWDKVGSKIGTYNREFASKFGSFLKLHNSKLRNFSYWEQNKRSNIDTEIQEVGDKFKSYHSNFIEKHIETASLGQFSQWLEDFDWTINRIEVPGQYDNVDRPYDPSCHAVILGIDERVLVMKSKTQPKRLVLRGSQGKDHMFLMKGGEDLRNDERVMQLLKLMNSFLPHTDGGLSSNEMLRARTFTVVPMTTRVGLLEWVKDTKTLQSIISEEMILDKTFLNKNNKFGSTFHIQNISAYGKRLAWIGSHNASSYFNSYISKSSEEAQNFWNNEICTNVPHDFIKRALIRISQSSEAFISCRQNFACTLATSNIWGYIIGLGDRHLENLLVDVTSGDIVQIDFGYSFGVGTDKLPVPELLPFRLTRNLEKVLEPLDCREIYHQYMSKCLSACKEPDNTNELISELEIYKNEPIVEWQRRSLSQMTDTEIKQLKSSESWEPNRRITTAIKKLKGTHPVSILIDELSINPAKNMYSEKSNLILMKKILEDVCQKPIPNEEDETLSTEEQVDALISIAMSPEILARQWVGLTPWI